MGIRIKDLPGFPVKVELPKCIDCGCRGDECGDIRGSEACVYVGEISRNKTIIEIGNLDISISEVVDISKLVDSFEGHIISLDGEQRELVEKALKDNIDSCIVRKEE